MSVLQEVRKPRELISGEEIVSPPLEKLQSPTGCKPVDVGQREFSLVEMCVDAEESAHRLGPLKPVREMEAEEVAPWSEDPVDFLQTSDFVSSRFVHMLQDTDAEDS